MAKNAGRPTAGTRTGVEKRGGYGSSSKVVTKLTPPPRGAAPGAKSGGSNAAGKAK